MFEICKFYSFNCLLSRRNNTAIISTSFELFSIAVNNDKVPVESEMAFTVAHSSLILKNLFTMCPMVTQ